MSLMKTLSHKREEVLNIAINELRGSDWAESIDEFIIADLETRSEIGLEKYGTTLQTHNGRDALVDSYEELLDALMYQSQYVAELEDAGHDNGDKVLDDNRYLLDIIMETVRKAAKLLIGKNGKGLLNNVRQPSPIASGWPNGYRIPKE